MNIDKEFEYIRHLIDQHPKYVETNWYVVTGSPSSGKTTSLKLLESTGYKINPDISRQYIEDRVKIGLLPENLRTNEAQLQKALFCLMIRNALSLKTDEIILHDYSLPDNIPFLKLAKLPISEEVQKSANLFRFRGVFIFEPLDLFRDGIRTETKEDQWSLYRLMQECYSNLGYKPIIVPNDTIENRHLFMLSHLPKIQSS